MQGAMEGILQVQKLQNSDFSNIVEHFMASDKIAAYNKQGVYVPNQSLLAKASSALNHAHSAFKAGTQTHAAMLSAIENFVAVNCPVAMAHLAMGNNSYVRAFAKVSAATDSYKMNSPYRIAHLATILPIEWPEITPAQVCSILREVAPTITSNERLRFTAPDKFTVCEFIPMHPAWDSTGRRPGIIWRPNISNEIAENLDCFRTFNPMLHNSGIWDVKANIEGFLASLGDLLSSQECFYFVQGDRIMKGGPTGRLASIHGTLSKRAEDAGFQVNDFGTQSKIYKVLSVCGRVYVDENNVIKFADYFTPRSDSFEIVPDSLWCKTAITCDQYMDQVTALVQHANECRQANVSPAATSAISKHILQINKEYPKKLADIADNNEASYEDAYMEQMERFHVACAQTVVEFTVPGDIPKFAFGSPFDFEFTREPGENGTAAVGKFDTAMRDATHISDTLAPMMFFSAIRQGRGTTKEQCNGAVNAMAAQVTSLSAINIDEVLAAGNAIFFKEE